MKLVSRGPYAGFACGAFDFPSIPLPYSPSQDFTVSRPGSPVANSSRRTFNPPNLQMRLLDPGRLSRDVSTFYRPIRMISIS